MATRTPAQLARRRQIEAVIRLAAPVLDVVLAVGEPLSRIAGRGQLEPEPPRRLGEAQPRTPIGGPPTAV